MEWCGVEWYPHDGRPNHPGEGLPVHLVPPPALHLHLAAGGATRLTWSPAARQVGRSRRASTLPTTLVATALLPASTSTPKWMGTREVGR